MIHSLKLSSILLTVVGLILTPVAFFIISSVPLTSGGLSVTFLGCTGIALTQPKYNSSIKASKSLAILLASTIIIFSAINILFALWEVSDIGLYFNSNAVAYFMIIMVYLSYNPKSKVALNFIGMLIFSLSLVFIAIKMFEILSQNITR
jgi:hypothetical protein